MIPARYSGRQKTYNQNAILFVDAKKYEFWKMNYLFTTSCLFQSGHLVLFCVSVFMQAGDINIDPFKISVEYFQQ